MTSLLPLAAVMTRLAKSRSEVYRLARSGRLRGVKLGRTWRFESYDVERYLADQREATRQQLAPPARRRTVTVRPPREDGRPELSLPGADHYL